ncbi:MAG TPA: hypothetical protein VH968_03200 [Gaiellaceae bacterium]
MSIGFPILFATLVWREPFLGRAGGPGHRRAALLDELPRVGVAVLVGLQTAPRVITRTVALLLRAEDSA